MGVNQAVFKDKIDRSKMDRTSSTYHEIKRYLDSMLILLRKENDSPKLDQLATATLRGRIAENRKLLSKMEPHKDTSTTKMRAN